MKKLFLMLLVIVTISSCKKGFDCQCVKDYNYNVVYTHTYDTKTSAEAYHQCTDDYSTISKNPYPSCSIK